MEQRTYEPIRIEPGKGLVILDQTLLPHQERYLEIDTVEALCEAIRALRVRGAPLLGLCGIAGMALAAERDASEGGLAKAADALRATRPTAVDLGAGLARAFAVGLEADEASRACAMWELAERSAADQYSVDDALAKEGATLLVEAGSVLTHCNTGALATGSRGTALAVIHEAFVQGHLERCYVTETRPLLQGARLTTWELQRLGIPFALLPDSAAASLIASGKVDAVVTGADRIAANGDTANKIGTYGLALAAREAKTPFYVAAPLTTVDLATRSSAQIPIEFRDGAEVGGFAGQRWSPDGIETYNPAFDVTPAACIDAIVTEAGVARPPFGESLAILAREEPRSAVR